MKALFGTDGIRGHADEFPLDDRSVFALGASLARQLGESLGRKPRMVTGRDTRESGPRIEAAFHAGASSAGAECMSADGSNYAGRCLYNSKVRISTRVLSSVRRIIRIRTTG